MANTIKNEIIVSTAKPQEPLNPIFHLRIHRSHALGLCQPKIHCQINAGLH